MKFPRWREEIQRWASFPLGWYGPKSKPPSQVVVAKTLAFLDLIEDVDFGSRPAPHMSPSPRGTIGIDWSVGHRELYVSFGDATTSYLAVEGDYEKEGMVGDSKELLEYVRWMLGNTDVLS